MIVPLLLFLVSVLGLAASVLLPDLSDFALLAVPSAVASFWLLLKARRQPKPKPKSKSKSKRGKEIILDGSNVMYWRGEGPELVAVKDVLASLSAQGFTPGVVFDANVGYKLGGRYLNDAQLGRLLGLPRDRVMVVPRGVPADQIILKAARDRGTRIVTNDRFRDWAEDHPEIHQSGHLIRGGYRAGALWFDMPEGV